MQNRCLGILVNPSNGDPPFADQTTYRQWSEAGACFGIRVFVFSPRWVAWRKNKTWGFEWNSDEKRWIKQAFPLPALVYDRCFVRRHRQAADKREFMRCLSRSKTCRLLGGGVRNKWVMYNLMMADSLLRQHLPDTELLRTPGADNIRSSLNRYQQLVLKPLAGCQGKGILHMIKTSDRMIRIRGRDRNNQPLHLLFADEEQLLPWLRQFTGRRPYLIQPALSIHTKRLEPFDIRALVQKNRYGRWQTTATTVRIGVPGGVTSNLHGGGKAHTTESFLFREFGEQKSMHMMSIIRCLCDRIAPYLEQSCGRLVELGLDFGIDRQAKVWILEVNSKPGRAAFAKQDAVSNAVRQQPILYAKYLLERSQQVFIPERT